MGRVAQVWHPTPGQCTSHCVIAPHASPEFVIWAKLPKTRLSGKLSPNNAMDDRIRRKNTHRFVKEHAREE